MTNRFIICRCILIDYTNTHTHTQSKLFHLSINGSCPIPKDSIVSSARMFRVWRAGTQIKILSFSLKVSREWPNRNHNVIIACARVCWERIYTMVRIFGSMDTSNNTKKLLSDSRSVQRTEAQNPRTANRDLLDHFLACANNKTRAHQSLGPADASHKWSGPIWMSIYIYASTWSHVNLGVDRSGLWLTGCVKTLCFVYQNISCIAIAIKGRLSPSMSMAHHDLKMIGAPFWARI